LYFTKEFLQMTLPCTVEDWRSEGDFMTFNGHQIFYRDSDKNSKYPTVLLIHGFPTSSWDWCFIWPDLTSKFRVIAMDLLGFGFSDKPADITYSIHLQADVVEAVVRACNIPEATLLVHDYGVSVGQELLARHKEKKTFGIKAICFLNGGLFPETHRARFIQKLLNSPVGFLIARLGNEQKFRSSFSAVFGAGTRPSEEELKAYWRLITEQNGQRIFHRLIRYIEDRKQHRTRWVGALQQAEVPVRLINGLDDPVSGAHMLARYRAVVGEGDIVELSGIGHYPQCESPKAVATAFIEFAQP
jgi:pimeloyl-ACP methyl ester carboxylesterase